MPHNQRAQAKQMRTTSLLNKFTLACALACVLFGAACASNSPADTSFPEDISLPTLLGEWQVEWIEDSPVVAQSAAYIAFDQDGRIHGNSSVNKMFGSWSLGEGTLEIAQLGSTRMAGPPPLMDQERRFLAALGHVVRAEMSADGRLLLLSANGDALVTASPRSEQ